MDEIHSSPASPSLLHILDLEQCLTSSSLIEGKRSFFATLSAHNLSSSFAEGIQVERDVINCLQVTPLTSPPARQPALFVLLPP